MPNLLELALIFLRLGFTAFGGPAAHLALMEAEFVTKRTWLTREEFLDRMGVASLIPGPSSTEVAIYVGFARCGWMGLVMAGMCFVLPAVLIVTAIAEVYVRYGSLPGFQSALYGIKPVVLAIIVQAILSFSGVGLNSWSKRAVFTVVAALGLSGVSAVVLLLAGGVSFATAAIVREQSLQTAKPLVKLLAGVLVVAAVPVVVSSFLDLGQAASVTNLGLYFAKLGSVLYGSGYVLLSFLDHDLVTQLHWLTRSQLIDAASVGQFTPGPVFTTATFIGYLKAGPLGAFVSTVGIFLPSFVFVALTGRQLSSLRSSPVSAKFLDGVNAAAVGLMSVVAVRFGLESVSDLFCFCLALCALVGIRFFKLNSAVLITAGALLGLAYRLAFR